MTIDWSLCAVTDRRAAGERALLDLTRAAVQGGVSLVQLREKDVSIREALELGRALLGITRPAGVPLLVNDRIDLALALEADGAHVGQDDLPADLARRLLGPDRLLGVSASTVDEARRAVRDGADYLGVGDVFGTPSKPDTGAPIGLDGLAAIAGAVDVPILAIGGITTQNAGAAVEAGAAGVAVISAIYRADDPEAAARTLREAMQPR